MKTIKRNEVSREFIRLIKSVVASQRRQPLLEHAIALISPVLFAIIARIYAIPIKIANYPGIRREADNPHSENILNSRELHIGEEFSARMSRALSFSVTRHLFVPYRT